MARVTDPQLQFPREWLLAQNARVPPATWGQVPLWNVKLEIVLSLFVRNLDDVPLHSKRRGHMGLPGNTEVVLHLQRY